MIKYILLDFFLLFLIILFFNLTQNKNISNNLEYKSNPKKKTPLEKEVPTIKNELKLIENEVDLNCSLKGTNITNGNNQQIKLIIVFITINNKCLAGNCFDCYTRK